MRTVYQDKKIKALILVFISALLLGTVTGCGSTGDFQFSQFARDDQSFNFPKTEWGMSVAEVEKALGYELGGFPYDIESDSTDFSEIADFTGACFKEDVYSLSGIKGLATFQFMNGRLWAAGVKWDIEKDGDRIIEEALEEARKAFGDETESKIDKPFKNPLLGEDGSGGSSLLSTEYLWERTNGETVSARLFYLKTGDDITSISFDIAQFLVKY